MTSAGTAMETRKTIYTSQSAVNRGPNGNWQPDGKSFTELLAVRAFPKADMTDLNTYEAKRQNP